MDVSNFYDQFSDKQNKSGVHKRHLIILEWLKYFGLKSDDKVLEIGSGVGTVTGLLSGFLKDGRLTANDISAKSIDIARERLKTCRNINFIVGDITKTNISEKFDVIVLPDVLEHIPSDLHNELFSYLHKRLNEKGFIAIHIPNPYYLEWVIENRPEELQVIDQPLHINFLADTFHKSRFYVSYLNNYAIWNDKPDYQILQLRKIGNLKTFDRLPAEPLTIRKRAVNKLKSIFGLRIFKLPI